MRVTRLLRGRLCEVEAEGGGVRGVGLADRLRRGWALSLMARYVRIRQPDERIF